MTSAVSASSAQFEASHSGTIPMPEPVAQDVWAISAPIPEGQIPYTLTYVLRSADKTLTLVDPGWDTSGNFATLRASLARLGFELGQVSSTISTHFHPDHLAIAPRVREAVGAKVIISETEQRVLRHEEDSLRGVRSRYDSTMDHWNVPHSRRAELLASFERPNMGGYVTADELLEPKEIITAGDHELRVIATPGHTSGHICLVDDQRRLLYTGDHVLPEIFSGLGIGSLPGTTPLSDYFESLALLEPFDDYLALPGHEYRFTGLAARRAEIARHHLRRTREVIALTQSLGNAPAWEYGEKMSWTAGWSQLRGFMLHSALRQRDAPRIRSERSRSYVASALRELAHAVRGSRPR